jgi:tetratricopeptide (TPR) repeat protein
LYFEKKKDYARAAEWFEKGADYARHSPDDILGSKVRGIFIYLGKSYLELGQPDRAVPALKLALELAEQAHMSEAAVQIRADLAKAEAALRQTQPVGL